MLMIAKPGNKKAIALSILCNCGFFFLGETAEARFFSYDWEEEELDPKDDLIDLDFSFGDPCAKISSLSHENLELLTEDRFKQQFFRFCSLANIETEETIDQEEHASCESFDNRLSEFGKLIKHPDYRYCVFLPWEAIDRIEETPDLLPDFFHHYSLYKT